MNDAGRHLAVGRLRKAHGLKGDVAVFPLTDRPDEIFATGVEVWVQNLAGEIVAGPLVIERSRSYHREWLIKLEGADERAAIDAWKGMFLSVPQSDLAPPEGDELYLHELTGFAVRNVESEPLGLVSDVVELPGGSLLIEVQGPKREFLLPYRKEFVTEVNREGRVLTISPPDGLLEE